MTARGIRIGILLLVLGFVALDAWLTRTRAASWDKTLRMSIYPIAADGQASTRDYVAQLKREDFAGIEAFLQREAQRHGVRLAEPLRVRLGAPLDRSPPLPPADRGALGTIAWSLQLRWFSWRRESAQPRPRSQVRMFVLYYDPDTTPAVAHSLGLQKGMVGIVHAFASRAQAPTNNVVIAHELLHTLGASDKYDPASGLPRFPDGFAEPERNPRFPQRMAELMGGRVPLSPGSAEIPVGLDEVRVGAATAREIGWIGP